MGLHGENHVVGVILVSDFVGWEAVAVGFDYSFGCLRFATKVEEQEEGNKIRKKRAKL